MPGQELIELLEHHHTVWTGPLDVVALEPDGASRRRNEPGDRLKQCRLTAPRWTKQNEPVGLIDVETDSPSGGNKVLRGLVLKRDMVNLQQDPPSWRTGFDPRRCHRAIDSFVVWRSPTGTVGASSTGCFGCDRTMTSLNFMPVARC